MFRSCCILGVVFAIVLGAQAAPAPARSSKTSVAVYPVKVSANRRYLVDRNNVPFLIAGDTPHAVMGRLTEAEADYYFANREAHGFNTMGWINITSAGHEQPTNTYAATPDGIRPFTGFLPGGTDFNHYDFSKPNEAYFTRLDHIVELAAKHHLFVFLDPAETMGWLPALRNNGVSADYRYGQYLGNRYKRFPNVAWLHGNDFNTWRNPGDDAVVRAVAEGIKSVDPDQIQTAELNVVNSSSLDDPTWTSLLSLNSTYAYGPTYIQMLHSYNQKPLMPTYLVEAHYDLESVGRPPDYGTPPVLRREEYWTMLSGGAGQFYGNAYTWTLQPGWRGYIDTVGVKQLTIWKNFFSSLPWQNLVPDQKHSIVTAGLGSFGDYNVPVSQSDFCTAASTPDGSFVVAYLPTVRTVTINMSGLKGRAVARWFDPADGTYKTISGSPFANAGSRQFTPPGKNHDRDGDWVLLLHALK